MFIDEFKNYDGDELKNFVCELLDFMNDIKMDSKSECCKNKIKNDDNSNHSYYHYTSDHYENGEHVSHKEKEVKDGKVLKNINNSTNFEGKKKISNNKACTNKDENKVLSNEQDVKSLEKRIHELEEKIKIISAENKMNKSYCEKYEKKIAMLEDINNKLQDEKHELEMKFASIKAMF